MGGKHKYNALLPADIWMELGRLFRYVLIDTEQKTVKCVFLGFSSVTLPFDWFMPSGITSPDFTKPRIIDDGQTLALGEYEVDVDAIHEYREARRI